MLLSLLLLLPLLWLLPLLFAASVVAFAVVSAVVTVVVVVTVVDFVGEFFFSFRVAWVRPSSLLGWSPVSGLPGSVPLVCWDDLQFPGYLCPPLFFVGMVSSFRVTYVRPSSLLGWSPVSGLVWLVTVATVAVIVVVIDVVLVVFWEQDPAKWLSSLQAQNWGLLPSKTTTRICSSYSIV